MDPSNPRRRRFPFPTAQIFDHNHRSSTSFLRARRAASKAAQIFCRPSRIFVVISALLISWLFVDLDSYPLWIFWWGGRGPPQPDTLLTRNCVEPNYSLPLAVVIPLITSQVPRLQSSMALWTAPNGLPCANPPTPRPNLFFYFDLPLSTPAVRTAIASLKNSTAPSTPLGRAIRLCFHSPSFTTASLTPASSKNSLSFDVLRNLASTGGSNAQFHASFPAHALHRHMLYMEPDTWPLRRHWLSAVDAASRDASFWVRGSLMRYAPRLVVAPEPFRSAYTRHINGNALYALQDNCFARYRSAVRDEFGDAAFDVAMAAYRFRRGRYALEHALAHRFSAAEFVADLGVEDFGSVDELRARLPRTFLAHAKRKFVEGRWGIIQY